VFDGGHQRRRRLDHGVLRAGSEGDARCGRRVDPELLAHISPAHSENVNFFGEIAVDVERELARLGPTGYRPLRSTGDGIITLAT
jgi:hypothetical protein